MQKSGFFNAMNISGTYDRRYSADDYSDNLAVVISNGVLRSENDDLKVTASGLSASVGVGRAWIKGHYYVNTTAFSFSAVSTPAGGSRIDRIVLRLDARAQGRKIELVYVQGQAGNNPTPPAPVRNESLFDLVLADLTIAAGATTMTVTDRRSDKNLCGWVYSTAGDNSFFTSLDNSFNLWFAERRDTLASVTLFKRYNWRTVLQSMSSSVSFNVPQYDAGTCFIEVFVNGMIRTLDIDYELEGNVISFLGLPLTAGTEVEVKVYKSVDSTGIMTVADEITELQTKVAAMEGRSLFTYICTGTDDNIALSEIAQALYTGRFDAEGVSEAAYNFLTALGGQSYLDDMSDTAQITINVVGHIWAQTPFGGTGAADSRYKWFSLGSPSASQRKIVFDFAMTDGITVFCPANTSNIILFGNAMYVKNANINAGSLYSGCNVIMVNANNNSTFDDCRFTVNTSGDASIASGGVFTNCVTLTKSTSKDAINFNLANVSFVRVIGGLHKAYAKASGASATIFTIPSGAADAIAMASNINCPTVSESGFFQQYLCNAAGGKIVIDGVVSTMDSIGNNKTITNQIWKSKP